MVDALHRAHRIVSPTGFVIDLHPSAAHASVKVGEEKTGIVDGGDACLRHAGAGVALAAVVDQGLFAVDQVLVFAFNTYSDTAEELGEYVATHWREGRIADEMVERTREAAARGDGARPHICERVYMTKLRPLRGQAESSTVSR